MRAPRLPEPRPFEVPSIRRKRPLRKLGSSHFQDARRYAAHDCKIGNVTDHHGVRANDHIVPYPYAAEDLRTSTEVDAIADRGCTQWIVGATVTNGYTVTDQTVIADHGCPVYDDTAVMFDAQAATDLRGCPDDDAAENFRELVEYDVGNRPGSPHYPVADDETGVSETVPQQCPETDPQQSLALRLQVFQDGHRW